MKNLLSSFNDIFSKYTLDKVDCFERQIANALESFQTGYGHIYILINKMFEFFKDDEKESSYDYIKELLGVDICYEQYSFEELIKQIIFRIDRGIPVLLIGNLKKLFYSSYYMEKNYPHLFLVKGYDTKKELIYFLDNVQFGELDAKYENFRITYSLVNELTSNDSLCSIISINKLSNYKFYGIKEIIDKITQLFIHLLTREFNSILLYCKKSDNFSKEKFINFPKYIEVIFLEYQYLLSETYGNIKLDDIKDIFFKYKKYWEQYVIKKLVIIMRNPNNICDINLLKEPHILSIEKELICELNNINKKVQSFVQSKHMKQESPFIMENNEDRIFNVNKNTIKFDFPSEKIYNMWIIDEAPKLILYKGEEINFVIKLSLKILTDYTVGRFQIGIFLENGNDMYFAAIDNSNAVVIDMIGKDNLSYDTSITFNPTLIVRFENHELSLFLDDFKQSIISRVIPTKNTKDFNFGVCCKTWDKPGKLIIECTTEYLKIGDEIIDFG